MLAARIICLVIGYLAGLFQTGLIYGKKHHTDLRKKGSGNTGTTNSIRVMGWKAGVTVAAGDILKSVAAMVVVWLLFRNRFPEAVQLLELYAGFGAVLGHDFPFYTRFRGGKGIATTVGLICTYQVGMIPICALAFFLPVIPTGYMSLGSLGMVSAFLVQTIVFGQTGLLRTTVPFLGETYILVLILTVLAFFKHRENIRRLVRGEENKFSSGRKKNA